MRHCLCLEVKESLCVGLLWQVPVKSGEDIGVWGLCVGLLSKNTQSLLNQLHCVPRLINQSEQPDKTSVCGGHGGHGGDPTGPNRARPGPMEAMETTEAMGAMEVMEAMEALESQNRRMG